MKKKVCLHDQIDKNLEIWGNYIKAGFFNVIIQDIAVHGTNV